MGYLLGISQSPARRNLSAMWRPFVPRWGMKPSQRPGRRAGAMSLEQAIADALSLGD